MSMIGNLRLVSDERLGQLFANPDEIEDVLYDSDEPGEDDETLDKTWHALHFLLTGSAWEGEPPLNFLISGGREIGDVDVGYGPARGFTSSEVREIADSLDRVTSSDLRDRFDGQAMMDAQIYPEIWDRDPAEDDVLGYVLEYYEILKGFLSKARESSAALIVYLN